MLNTEGEDQLLLSLGALYSCSCSLLYLKIISGAPIAFVIFLLGRTGVEIQVVLDYMSHACHCHLCSMNNFWWTLSLACSPQFGLMRIPAEPKPLGSAQCNSSCTYKIVEVHRP